MRSDNALGPVGGRTAKLAWGRWGARSRPRQFGNPCCGVLALPWWRSLVSGVSGYRRAP